MSILVDNASRVVVQGITGREGAFHTERMLAAGTNIVAGVTPGQRRSRPSTACPSTTACTRRWRTSAPTSP